MSFQPNLPLGKQPARADARNLLFKKLLVSPPSLPIMYDVDDDHSILSATRMFLNDVMGTCVIAGRAHQTVRFQILETSKQINITDYDVRNEYLIETGGKDNGLQVLESLKLWRTRGWIADGKRYRIKAFSEIQKSDFKNMMRAIYLNAGIGMGLQLPYSARQQFYDGKIWDISQSGRPDAALWGGHYVYVTGYDPIGLTCITWGRKQKMTWDFVDVYADEAYAIIDAEDKSIKNVFNFDFLKTYLARRSPVENI